METPFGRNYAAVAPFPARIMQQEELMCDKSAAGYDIAAISLPRAHHVLSYVLVRCLDTSRRLTGSHFYFCDHAKAVFTVLFLKCTLYEEIFLLTWKASALKLEKNVKNTIRTQGLSVNK